MSARSRCDGVWLFAAEREISPVAGGFLLVRDFLASEMALVVDDGGRVAAGAAEAAPAASGFR